MGTWLDVFKSEGIDDILGLDGDHIDRKSLLIPKDKFRAVNLTEKLVSAKKFDLVLSLEVAEHIPSEFADIYIDNLVNLGDVIYFSAAIPFQGGTNHQNEQWQNYWAKKFKERNFIALDAIRKLVWENTNVVPCYSQNGIIYVKQSKINHFYYLIDDFEKNPNNVLSLVHPKIFESIANPLKRTFREELNILKIVLSNRIKARLRNILFLK